MKISTGLFLPFVLAFAAPALCQQTPSPKKQAAVPVLLTAGPAFDEKADAKATIQKAIETAAIDDIRVLITWGTNHDKASKLFLDSKWSPALQAFFMHEYKTANVHVGNMDANVGLAKSYAAMLKADALPALTILDSAGKVIANTNADALRPGNDPAGVDSAKVAAFLKSHQAPAPNAVASFEAALEQAKKEGKTVFVWFSAPW